MEIDPRPIKAGDRVLVSDNRLYKNDKDTPWKTTLRPATVIRRYGHVTRIPHLDIYWTYPDCVDVEFDHRKEGDKISSCFTSYVVTDQ